ncbi:hypothetical protein D9M71_353440 [compost metagenome]
MLSVSGTNAGPPTGSNTTRAPLPSVIAMTRSTMSSSSLTMTCAAPASSKACALARVRVMAMAVAPVLRAIWKAARPTRLEAAVTSRKSPWARRAWSINAPQAVTYCIHAAAACSKDSLAGCLTVR